MSSAEFIDYVGTLIPELSQETQFKASCMLMHMITLMVGKPLWRCGFSLAYLFVSRLALVQ